MTNSYKWRAGSNSHWMHIKFDPKIRCLFLSLSLLPKCNFTWEISLETQKWKCYICLPKVKHSIWGSFLSSLLSFNICLYYFKICNQGKITRQGIMFFLPLLELQGCLHSQFALQASTYGILNTLILKISETICRWVSLYINQNTDKVGQWLQPSAAEATKAERTSLEKGKS